MTKPRRPAPPLRMLETALYVDDLDAAADFYGRIVGLAKIVEVPGRHVFYRCGPGMLLLFVAAETRKPAAPDALPVPPHGASGAGHAAFAVIANELDGWRAELEAQGVAIEADFRWPNGARSVYVRDPAGNSLEFAEPGLWGFTG